jgi:citrate lyase subunit beta / citryl-CoA lyase
MLETPRAILDAAEVAHASPRLVGFVMGTNDLAKELRAAHVPGRAPLLPSLAWCLLAVRDAGKTIVDGVFNDLDDAEGFAAECRQAVELGFDGKTVIHPRQLEPCNAAFTPTDAEVARAREVIARSRRPRRGPRRRHRRRQAGREPARRAGAAGPGAGRGDRGREG